MFRTPLLLAALPATTLAAIQTVCVDVQVKSWTQDPPEDSKTAPTKEEPPPFDPFAIDPARYLERMMRYEVTHEVGFSAVDRDCDQRMVIELYPLPDGWTVFGRFSGTTREEKVDHVRLDELNSLAQRLAQALLRDRPITDTITRENVLQDYSETGLRTIRANGHFVLAFGSELRVAELPTASGSGVREETQFLTPLDVQLGYRGKYQAWGLDAFVRGNIGMNQRAERRTPEGGHVDYEGGGAFGLHFLRYFNAPGMTSVYLGGGALFGFSAFSVIKPEVDRGDGDRDYLFGGGLDATLLVGMEFMRASSVHFYWQLEGHAPTYVFDTEVDAGGIDTWTPGGALQIGMVF